jgi:hypothetical protein
VRDEDIGEAEPLLQLGHEVQDLCLHRDVERGGRLVADQQIGLAGERTGNRDALALAPGEFVRILVAVIGGETDLDEQLVGAPCHSQNLHRLCNDVAHPPARV